MRERYRKSIASLNKFPQFTTMNVIDGQADLKIYSSLIFYSLTIDNILNIIVLLILAGVTIATLTGDNGVLNQASKAKEKTTEAESIERVQVEVAGSYGLDGKIDKDQLNKNLKNITGLMLNGTAFGGDNLITSLPATVTLKGYDIVIDANGDVNESLVGAETPIDISKFYLKQINEVDGNGAYTKFKIIGVHEGCDLYYWYYNVGVNNGDPTTKEELISKSKKYDDGTALANDVLGSNAHVFIYLSKNNGETIDSPIVRFDPSSICFKEDTLVGTNGGLKKIQDVNIGDYVYSYNEESEIVEEKEVLKVFKNRIKAKLCEVYINNEKIISTTNHPFYSNEKWIEACKLKKNDILKNQFGNNFIIEKEPTLTNEQENVVYNLEVDDNHNYFVGKTGVLVHNAPSVFNCSYADTIVYGEVFEF